MGVIGPSGFFCTPPPLVKPPPTSSPYSSGESQFIGAMILWCFIFSLLLAVYPPHVSSPHPLWERRTFLSHWGVKKCSEYEILSVQTCNGLEYKFFQFYLGRYWRVHAPEIKPLSIFEVHFLWCFRAKGSCVSPSSTSIPRGRPGLVLPHPSGMIEPNGSIIFDTCLAGFSLWPRMIGSIGLSCMATHRATCHAWNPPRCVYNGAGVLFPHPHGGPAPLRMVREEGLAPCYRSYFPVIGVRRPNPIYICFPSNVPITRVRWWMAVLIIWLWKLLGHSKGRT